MMDDQDKTLYTDVSNTIKTAIGYLLKLALDKISYVNFFKLAQITKKWILLGRLCFSLTLILSSTSFTHICLLILHTFFFHRF